MELWLTLPLSSRPLPPGTGWPVTAQKEAAAAHNCSQTHAGATGSDAGCLQLRGSQFPLILFPLKHTQARWKNHLPLRAITLFFPVNVNEMCDLWPPSRPAALCGRYSLHAPPPGIWLVLRRIRAWRTFKPSSLIFVCVTPVFVLFRCHTHCTLHTFLFWVDLQISCFNFKKAFQQKTPSFILFWPHVLHYKTFISNISWYFLWHAGTSASVRVPLVNRPCWYNDGFVDSFIIKVETSLRSLLTCCNLYKL